jgi:hypothetical protein
MKKIPFFIFYLCTFNNSFSQDLVVTDTVNCNQTIKFKKVKKSFQEANTALMKLDYNRGNEKAIIQFNIPSFIYRLKTTRSDYCIITTKKYKIKLQNTVETNTKERDFISYYDFTFELPTDSLRNIFTDKIKKVTFYFTPNPAIKEYVNQNKLVNKSYDKLVKRVSKKTITYKISKPEKEQYNQALSCLNKPS